MQRVRRLPATFAPGIRCRLYYALIKSKSRQENVGLGVSEEKAAKQKPDDVHN